MATTPPIARLTALALGTAVLLSCHAAEALFGGGGGDDERVAWQLAEARVTTAPTPAVAHGRLYARTSPSTLSAYDFATRRLLWRAESADNLPNREWQVSNVLVVGDLVVFGALQGLTAVDAVTGARRWVWFPSLGGAVGYDFPVHAHEGTLYVGTRTPGMLYVIDAASGTERWRTPVVGPTPEPQAAEGPVTDGDAVAIGFRVAAPRADSGGVACYDAVTGRERWRVLFPPSAEAPFGGSQGDVLIVGDVVVASDVYGGRVFGFDLATGRERWRVEPERTPEYRRLAVVDGIVAAGSAWGAVTGLDPATGRQLWRTPLARNASVLSRFTAADGQFFIAAVGGDLVVLDARTGALRWTYSRSRRNGEGVFLAGPVTVTPDLVLVTSLDGLYALRR